MSGQQILVVSNDLRERALLVRQLTVEGYQVAQASTGTEALTQIRVQQPDLVITEDKLPELNGMGLLRTLRHDERFSNVHLILLSERKRTEDVIAAHEAGADEYLIKPVDASLLMAKMGVLLRRGQVRVAPVSVEERAGKIVTFLHGKGGVGTTTLAVNTGVLLSSTTPNKVALVDLNLDFSNAPFTLDLTPQKSLVEMAVSGFDITDRDLEAYGAKHKSGLTLFLGASKPENAELLTVEDVRAALVRLRESFDLVLVDTPARFSPLNLAVLDDTSLAVFVTTQQLPAIRATAEYARVLEQTSFPQERRIFVLNRTAQGGVDTKGVMLGLSEKVDLVIPTSELVQQSIDQGRPLVLQGHAGATAVSIGELAELIRSRTKALDARGVEQAPVTETQGNVIPLMKPSRWSIRKIGRYTQAS